VLWLLLGRGTCEWIPRKLGGLLIRIDSLTLGFRVLDVLCVPNLGGCPDEMTE
jgi:hypothetical protein